MRGATLLMLATLLVASSAHATSVKTTPAPGITHIHRTGELVRGAVQDYHVLLVDLTAPTLRVRTSKESDKGHTTSWYGTTYGAHVAVNASFFDSTHEACGATQSFGAFWTKPFGTCTNSVAFTQGAAFFFGNGGKLDAWPASASAATDGVSGLPWLIKDGVSQAPFTDPMSINSRNARVGVGITASGKTLILVEVDAGTSSAQGMTGSDLVLVFQEFAAQQALNLDGTASASLFVKSEGGLVSKPSTGAEIAVANALVIVPVAPPESDGGVDATVDGSMDGASEAASDAATSGPEDPTNDAGDPVDASSYDDPGPQTIAHSNTDGNSGCVCRYVPAGRAPIAAWLSFAALAVAMTRRRATIRRGSRGRGAAGRSASS